MFDKRKKKSGARGQIATLIPYTVFLLLFAFEYICAVRMWIFPPFQTFFMMNNCTVHSQMVIHVLGGVWCELKERLHEPKSKTAIYSPKQKKILTQIYMHTHYRHALQIKLKSVDSNCNPFTRCIAYNKGEIGQKYILLS